MEGLTVIKRNGTKQAMNFDKITKRISLLADGLNVDPQLIALLTIQNISLEGGVRTASLDKIAADIAFNKEIHELDYGRLAARIWVSDNHKSTPASFSAAMREHSAALHPAVRAFIEEHGAELDAMIVDARDDLLDYVGLKTLEHTYLWKIGGRICDRPQYLFMREAMTCAGLTLGGDTADLLARIGRIYGHLSALEYTHATPTLYNSCKAAEQLGSCFLLSVDDNSESILGCAHDVGNISRRAGGIGIAYSKIRGEGESIGGIAGASDGIMNQLKVLDASAVCWNQGRKRAGAIAIYLEPWHRDILQFLTMKLPQGADEVRARNLFYGLWVNDLFMRRLLDSKPWSLFSHNRAPGLVDLYDGMEVCAVCNRSDSPAYEKYALDGRPRGPACDRCRPVRRDAFTELYEHYERTIAHETIDPQAILSAICTSQRESGIPYICFKDVVNTRSNQRNIGTVQSSNLCTEIMEVATADNYACCTLASINLNRLVTPTGEFDFAHLRELTREIVGNLNVIIDANAYPVKKCVANAHRYRPIGIGVQGLADVFAKLRLPFLSGEAEALDLKIHATIYHAALEASCDEARARGPYEAFAGSPAARGVLQFDFTGEPPPAVRAALEGFDWARLRADIARHGLRNSLLVALMPTVSTSQILGNNEAIEPYSANIYTKNTAHGKYVMLNKHCVRHLARLGLWNDGMLNKLMTGSLQELPEVPPDVKEIYKTVREMSQKELMRRAALRGAFVDQSTSLNIYLNANTNDVLSSVLVHGWKLGLKTGSYYIRSRPASKPMRTFTAREPAADVCPVGCESCSA